MFIIIEFRKEERHIAFLFSLIRSERGYYETKYNFWKYFLLGLSIFLYPTVYLTKLVIQKVHNNFAKNTH